MTYAEPISLSGEYAGHSIHFSKEEIRNPKFVNGKEFPYFLRLDQSEGKLSLDTIVGFLSNASKTGLIDQLLTDHGVLVLRGLGDSSPEAFSKIINAIERSRGRVPYEEVGRASIRVEKGLNVFTANESPPDRKLYQHSEYARYTRFPSNIHFFGNVAAPEGGETPLAHQGDLFNRLQAKYPEIVSELAKRGLKGSYLHPAKGNEINGNEFTWEDPLGFGQEILQTDSIEVKKVKAEKQVRRITPEFRWLDNNDLEVTQSIPAFRVHPVTGKPVWFNGLLLSAGELFDSESRSSSKYTLTSNAAKYTQAYYQDGEAVPDDVLRKIYELSLETEVYHKWQEGDIVLIDNYQASHGRLPWSGGDRKVLISMWDVEDDNLKPKPWVSS
ncbi:unnamed protein product [Kuraishia capsulata CBS 1993]|uniref:TauD/TfdA-like domain-containing protein n=1 Tax=Kuraishia capsulata CBS 1993 TaxID=1382522 RepID=W6MGH6_9ASCO|nr:uncharacterized protein KUCA_T00001176001 [Kuraishia capsulata CBS 1993]CDK25209.1 unnamed protein product [Kuraishia capsulata CBS 1993]